GAGTVALVLFALLAPAASCGGSGGSGDATRDADFYARRYYAIPERPALPGAGTQVILAGVHDTAKGEDRFGTGEISGYFFVDLDSPELTHWNATPGEPSSPAATFGDRHQLPIYGHGTYGLAPETAADMRGAPP